MLIVKKFKWLRAPDQWQGLAAGVTPGMAATGKWTFRGYKEA